jgi:hypothetical protein
LRERGDTLLFVQTLELRARTAASATTVLACIIVG